MMGHSLALAALLGVITLLHTADGHLSNCCIKNGNKIINIQHIVGYRVQVKGFCPITSVAFLTKRDRWICWDPEEPFVVKAMQKVDQIRRKEQKENIDTVTPTPSKDIGQTPAPLSSNSTQMQTQAMVTMTVNGQKKNSVKRKNRRRPARSERRKNRRKI
ncbi:hypothetical protein WMY93_001501 [Mugilogobius chulae]|uniref:Chemokine interleukin-8-like domain-containing protein n=1 Tax=Mugilogobius chulae TaxID=88201 RepID=A0AAW0Q3E4_9GOBI